MGLLDFLKQQNQDAPPVPPGFDNFQSVTPMDIIVPNEIDVKPTFLNLGGGISRTYFIFSYPRYLNVGWLSQIINMDSSMDISLYIHPMDTAETLKELRRRVTDIEAEMMDREQKGLIRDPSLETAYKDLEELRTNLQTGQERIYNFGLYITIYADNENQLNEIELQLRQALEARLSYIKPAYYEQKEGFISTSPYCWDLLVKHSPMNTQTLATSFPFISFDLSSNEGIFYGINKHNNSLVLFDRFGLPNANEVIFASAGSGKSFFAKLEILRHLMFGTDIIVIDPENEYKFLSEAVGGSFFNISLSSPNHVNPFDISLNNPDENPSDVLRSSIISLVGLFRIMLGGLSPEEDSIIDQAITETYAAKDITAQSDPATWSERTPIMDDFEAVLQNMQGTEHLLAKIRKYTQGTFAQFFNQKSTINLDNNLVVFGIRDMEDSLRPIAIYMVMKYVWNMVRSNLKKRILVIDEAWWLMQNEDSASFLFGIVKRARKYWLGVTTITQDVEDFMKSSYGKPVITNSAISFLMKQSDAAIEIVKQTFNLTDGEKMLLVESPVGEGIFFAGQKHVVMRAIASYAENQFITTSPEEVKKIIAAKKIEK